MNFPKLTLLLSLIHLHRVLLTIKHKSHLFLGHPAGEELSYDINFAKEVDKIEYYCGAKKCKK